MVEQDGAAGGELPAHSREYSGSGAPYPSRRDPAVEALSTVGSDLGSIILMSALPPIMQRAQIRRIQIAVQRRSPRTIAMATLEIIGSAGADGRARSETLGAGTSPVEHLMDAQLQREQRSSVSGILGRLTRRRGDNPQPPGPG